MCDRRPAQVLYPLCGGPVHPEREGVRRSGLGFSRLTRPRKGTPGTLEFRAQAWLGLSKGGLDQASSKETESEAGLRAGPRRVSAKLGVGDQDPRGSPRLRGVGGFRASESRAGLAS